MTAPDEAPPRRRRWLRWLAWTSAVVVLLLGVLRAAAPELLESQLESRPGAALGAHVRLENVDLWVFAGAVRLEGLAIAPSAESEPGVSLARGTADLAWSALVRREIRLENVELEGLEVLAHRAEDGSLRLPGILGPSTPPSEPEPEEEPPSEAGGGGPPLRLDRIALLDARAELRDDVTGRSASLRVDDLELGPLALDFGPGVRWSLEAARAGAGARLTTREGQAVEIALDAQVAGLGSEATEPGELDLTLRSGDGSLQVQGPVSVREPVPGLRLVWEGLVLPELGLLLPPETRPALRAGTTSGELELGVLAREDARPGALELRGRVAVDGLDAELDAPPVAAAWDALAVEVASVRIPLAGGEGPATTEVRLASAELRSPRVRVSLPFPSDAEETPAEEEEEPAAGEGEPAVRLALDALRVREGTVTLADRSFDPPHRTSVSGVRLDVSGVSWPETRVREIALSAAGLGDEPLSLEGSVAPERIRAKLDAERVSLLPANPYVRRHTSYSVQRGELSLQSDVEIDGPTLRAPTRVVFHDLDLDGDDPGGFFREQFGLSPDVALVLLRNPGGDIVLDLPIEGSRDGTGVALFSLLQSTLRRVLVNALASPLKIAGALVPFGGPEGPEFSGHALTFEPGAAQLDDEETAQLEEVRSLLTDRPALGLRLEVAVTAADARALGVTLEEGAAPDAAAAEALRNLAERRLAGVREQLLEGLAGEASRVLSDTWKGGIGEGEPRVEGHLMAVADDL